MSHSQEHAPEAAPRLRIAYPQLFVADVRRAVAYYETLGFQPEYLYGEPPFYGQVVRDRARLNLRVVCEPVFAGDIREREGLLSASITVAGADEIKQLFLSYQAAGVSFQQSLKKEPWGAITFVVMDPDGNLILFAGPAAGFMRRAGTADRSAHPGSRHRPWRQN